MGKLPVTMHKRIKKKLKLFSFLVANRDTIVYVVFFILSLKNIYKEPDLLEKILQFFFACVVLVQKWLEIGVE